MQSINSLAVLIAFIALQMLGFAWYHEALLGTPWMVDVGIDPNHVPQPPASVWIVMAVGALFKVVLLAIILDALGVDGLAGALAWGFALGFGLLALTLASHHGFAMRPVRQSLIEGSQEIVGAMLAAAILTLMPKRKS